MSYASKQAVPSAALKLPSAYLLWAALGAYWFLFQMYVWGSWITGPHFVAVDSGPDPVPQWQQTFLFYGQIICTLLALLCLWKWVVVPWRRERRMTSDVMIVIAATTVWFWDFSPSVIVDQVNYNSYMFNRGSWGQYAWPGWVSPAGHLVAEPLFFVPPGYTVLVTSQIIFVCWLLRRLKERRPDTSTLTLLLAIPFATFLVDSIIEIAFLRTGLYAYPAAIHAVTLFAGETYQFPLTEGILFGGLAVGAMGILKFFKDDKGRTFVECGIERLRIGDTQKQLLRLLSIYGFIHTAFFVLYMLPGMLVAVNADHYPTGYPSHMLNGMCRYGATGDQCPGPGVSIPRQPK